MQVSATSVVLCLVLSGLFVISFHIYGNVLSSNLYPFPKAVSGEAAMDIASLKGRRFINEIVTERDAGIRELVTRLIHNSTNPDDKELVNLVRDIIDKPGENALPKIHISQVLRTPQGNTVDQILHSKKNGFFIESGAYDGEMASNTIFLERSRNWTGLLVEMDPYFYTMLRSKNRRTHCLNACVSPKKYPLQIPFAESTGQGGKLDTKIDKKLRPYFAVSSHNVSCFPLETLLLALNRTQIDYWSLDVEGMELDVLETVPFDRLNISVISVEYIHVPRGKEAVRTYMEGQGYTMYKDLQFTAASIGLFVKDYIFVKNELLPNSNTTA